MFRKFFTALLIFWAGCASAMLPENGVWWNPNEGGTGYNLEIQNDKLWFYAYTYESNGLPVYLYGIGAPAGTNRFAGTLMKSGNGSCIACSYHPNTQSQVGNMVIQFDSPSTATLTATTAEGTRSTRLQRFAFLIDERNPYKMFGEWAVVKGTASFPIYFGERLGFGAIYTASDGSLSAQGSRSGSPSNAALARQETDGSWSLILDSSSSYYQFYSFRFSGLNTMEGTSWTFLKTENLSGTGLPFIALRSGSASSVISGTGPSLQKSANQSALMNYENVDASQAQFSATPTDDPKAIFDFVRAQQIVREMLNR